MPPDQKLIVLCDRYWAFQRQEFPITAFFAGQAMPEDALMREAPEDHERRAAWAGAVLEELNHIDSQVLGEQDQATRALLQRELRNLVRSVEVKAHLRPSLFPLGPESSLISWANATTLKSAEGADQYVERLKLVAPGLAGVRVSLARGIAEGISYTRLATRIASENVAALAAGPVEESAYFGPFLRSGGRFEAAAERAKAIIAESVLPAHKEYASFVGGPLHAAGRDSLACTDDALGDEFYAYQIEANTTLTREPAEIHALGLAEVERITAEMEAVAATAGFGNDLEGYRRRIMSDNAMVAASAEALREQIEVLSKRIDAKIPEFFGRVPRSTYGVRSIPATVSQFMPPAYAQPNPADNSAAGVHWVTSHPAKLPSYLHIAIALHEAWPGHLMHLALMQEMETLPAFRRYGALKYSACLEGWALYCERLGEDMGLYDSNENRYGRLDTEMWRACRLVVDTGLHAKGWSRQQAIDFMRLHLALPLATIEAEVDRYVALPGQALSYQLGNLKFRELRARAEQSLGDRFDLRSFHDALMAAGPVTLPVLDNLIGVWERERAAA